MSLKLTMTSQFNELLITLVKVRHLEWPQLSVQSKLAIAIKISQL